MSQAYKKWEFNKKESNTMNEKFSNVSEYQITRAIVKDFCDDFLKNLKVDGIWAHVSQESGAEEEKEG